MSLVKLLKPSICGPPRDIESGPLVAVAPSLSAAKLGVSKVKKAGAATGSRLLRPIKAMEDPTVSLRNDYPAISGTAPAAPL